MGLAWGRYPASWEVWAGFPHPVPPPLTQELSPVLDTHMLTLLGHTSAGLKPLEGESFPQRGPDSWRGTNLPQLPSTPIRM